MRRVSVESARARFSALIRDAESEPIAITGRGEPVAILLSSATYDRLSGKLSGKSEGLWSSLQRFRESHGLEALDVAASFENRG